MSMITRPPAAVCTDTHAVLPPYTTVSGPGAGIDPRTPQKRIFIYSSPSVISRPSYALTSGSGWSPASATSR